MPSLTPQERADEATEASIWEGYINGFYTLIPSTGAVYLATKNWPAFAKRTNWQSRTALAIMPALFAFGFTSEHRMTHKMREIAKETEYHEETVKWAEQQRLDSLRRGESDSHANAENALMSLYRQSVEESGVIVPELKWYHNTANFVATNPVKVLAATAVPTVLTIFYGRSGKEHLALQSKLMHTRVFGQFATLSLFFSVIAFKEFMDSHGKFISEEQAEAQVYEMQRVRQLLLAKLDHERKLQEEYQATLKAAHEQDVLEHRHVPHKKKNHKKHAKKEQSENEVPHGEQEAKL